MTATATTTDSSSFSTTSLHHVDRGGLLLSPPPEVAHHMQLLDAAACADVENVSRALREGADINACDSKGRTVLGYAIGGERWEETDASDASYMLSERTQILRTLLEHPEISLHTLNAPQAALRGVTPLGLAAWLNVPDMVRLLLEVCPGIVSVDGMDSLGATPLMYAARDGRIEVVELLLSHGARSDYRDISHRTSIQHALRHPQVLWLCENALRIHRAQEQIADPYKRSLDDLHPSLDEHFAEMSYSRCHPLLTHASLQDLNKTTDSIIHAISCSDVQKLYHLLFSSHFSTASSSTTHSHSLPPSLVNHPDAHGWSPIHHCVSSPTPSTAILDMLYRAGADMSLYTSSGHGTPLHCLAHKGRASTPASIQTFIRHLVFDLRAPLAAKDQNKETCIHVAAERGASIEILSALLACDTTGVVREMRNSRGLTALEVAKPEFRIAFGVADEERCGSSASTRTVKPSTTSTRSDSSLASLVAANLRRQYMAERTGHSVDRCSEGRADTTVTNMAMAQRILDALRHSSQALEEDLENVDIHLVDSLLRTTSEIGEELIIQFQSRVNEVTDDLQSARHKFEVVEDLLDEVTRLVEDSYGDRFAEIERAWDSPDSIRRRTTDSGDSGNSGSTAVSSVTSELGAKLSVDVQVEQTKTADAAPLTYPESWPAQSPSIMVHVASPNPPNIRNLAIVTSELADSDRLAPLHEENGLLRIMSPLFGPAKKKSKTSLTSKSFDDLRSPSAVSLPQESDRKESSGKSRFKKWIKKKLLPEVPQAHTHSLTDIHDVDEESCPVGREVKTSTHTPSPPPPPPPPPSFPIPKAPEPLLVKRQDPALHAARRIINTSSKDLLRIDDCITSADRYISRANRSITQAERIITRCIAQRETALERASLIQQMNEMQQALEEVVSSSGDIPFPEGPEEFLPVTIPTSVRNSQLVFPRPPQSPTLSTKSSMSSMTSTLNESDDDDVRALRRLVTRKIEERTDVAVEEVEKALDWLRVVKDTVQTLRRRT